MQEQNELENNGSSQAPNSAPKIIKGLFQQLKTMRPLR